MGGSNKYRWENINSVLPKSQRDNWTHHVRQIKLAASGEARTHNLGSLLSYMYRALAGCTTGARDRYRPQSQTTG